MYGDLETYDELWYCIVPKWWLFPEDGDYDIDEDEWEYEDRSVARRRLVNIRIR